MSSAHDDASTARLASTAHDVPTTTPARAATPARSTPREPLAALRGNCMGAAVLLIAEFALGIGVNLYVTVPGHKSFLPAVFSSAVLATHAIVALALLGAAGAALVRAIRLRAANVPGVDRRTATAALIYTSIGLAAVLAAGMSGATFVHNASNGASLAMALATAAAMFSYLAAIFRLR